MSVKIGINGFGRIGRLTFRAAIQDPRFKVMHINDTKDVAYLVYLLKYDSAHGRFPYEIKQIEGGIIYENF